MPFANVMCGNFLHLQRFYNNAIHQGNNNILLMNRLLFLLLCIGVSTFAQERKPLQGRIVSGESAVTGVFVINKATGTETKTDATGNFTVAAREGDMLAVYGTGITVREFAVNAMAFAEVPYVMEVTINAYELKEVVIDKITPESLGLVPKNQKQYTPAERRLKTASDLDPQMGIGTMSGVSVSADAIINAISGRTKMLKKALETENKEFAIAKLNGIYTEEQIVQDLKIPTEYVQGFLYYAVEDPECAAALKTKNNELAKFKLMGLAEKYNKLIADK